MIPKHMTEEKVKIIKIAKRLDISIFFLSEELIEIAELDISRRRIFAKEVHEVGCKAKIIDLIESKQNIDIRGYDITGDKALYQVDDDYYRQLIGEYK